MNCPVYLVLKTDGSIYAGLRKEDFASLTSVALKLEIHPGFGFGKIATIGGSAGAYTLTNNNHSDLGNKHANTWV